MRRNLTDHVIDRLKPGDSVLRIWDNKQPGFGVRMTPSGAKSFVFQFTRPDKTKVQGTIGTWPAWNTETAREEAQRLRKIHEAGGDAKATLTSERSSKTLESLVELWRTDYKPKLRPHSQACFESLLKRILPILGSRLVRDLALEDVKTVHRTISREGLDVTANRTATFLRRLLNISEAEGWRPIGTNPVTHLVRAEEQSRTRILNTEELQNFGAALECLEAKEKLDPVAADVFRFLLLSGLRKEEALKLRWQDVDLERGTMTFEVHKTKKKVGIKVLPLNSHLREILERRAAAKLSTYVFPGHFRRVKETLEDGSIKEKHVPTVGPLASLKGSWVRLVQQAGLGKWMGRPPKREFVPDTLINDLRRTFNSTCAELGYPYQVFDTLLGHKLPGVAGVYTHLRASGGILSEASQTTADWISAALKGLNPRPGVKIKTTAKAKRA